MRTVIQFQFEAERVAHLPARLETTGQPRQQAVQFSECYRLVA